MLIVKVIAYVLGHYEWHDRMNFFDHDDACGIQPHMLGIYFL